jgi:hypothetical protein
MDDYHLLNKKLNMRQPHHKVNTGNNQVAQKNFNACLDHRRMLTL